MRHPKPVRLGKRKLSFSRLVGAVSNCADAVRLKTAPTGGRKCLFISCIHYNLNNCLIFVVNNAGDIFV